MRGDGCAVGSERRRERGGSTPRGPTTSTGCPLCLAPGPVLGAQDSLQDSLTGCAPRWARLGSPRLRASRCGVALAAVTALPSLPSAGRWQTAVGGEEREAEPAPSQSLSPCGAPRSAVQDSAPRDVTPRCSAPRLPAARWRTSQSASQGTASSVLPLVAAHAR